MAIAHCSVKTVSRSGGRSATAAAAYRTAERVTDQRTGEVHDYRRRGGVEHVSMHLPANAPVMTTSELWSAAELAEKRKNSTVAREVEIALPYELAAEQRHALAKQIAERLVERYQVAAQVAVHTPDQESDQRNHHAHILCTTRAMDGSGQLGAKTRQLDDLKTGPLEVLWIRGMVETETNQALARAGIDARIDMRSLADQGIEREPTTHEGPRVTAIRRECEQEQRSLLGACDVIELNDARRLRPLTELRAEAQQIEAQIIDLEQYRQERALRRDVAELERTLAAPEPRCTGKAKKLKHQVEQKREDAMQWHREHPIRSRFCEWFGITSRADQEAEAARLVFNTSKERREAIQWQQEREQASQRLQGARQKLVGDPVVAEAMRRLKSAYGALRKAEGLSDNRMTWASIDERERLHQERKAHQELRRDIEDVRQRIPTRAEAHELEQRAVQCLDRMERWEQIEMQRRAEVQKKPVRRADTPDPGEKASSRSSPKL